MAVRREGESKRRGQPAGRRQQRVLWLVGFVALLVGLMIGSTIVIGRRSSAERAAQAQAQAQDLAGSLVVSEAPPPPNAERNGRAWGPKDAPIQVIEYADYECESCGAFATQYEAEFVETFAATGKVRFEIRNAPFHGEGARNAAEAAYCAADQNAFWPMHDSLFLNQPLHEGGGMDAFNDARLVALATRLNFDTDAFTECLTGDTYKQQVAQDLAATQQAGVTATPTFFINGQMFPGILSADDFRQIFAQVAPEVEFGP